MGASYGRLCGASSARMRVCRRPDERSSVRRQDDQRLPRPGDALTRSGESPGAGDSLARVVQALLSWYRRERRDLPWRRTRDPYAILVSEVMLQQTQVTRVIPRYEAWLARWPTAAALAQASQAEVLREWVGLGYNSRAVRLWEAARIVARSGWPERLEDLPGVGPYTAAAVGS